MDYQEYLKYKNSENWLSLKDLPSEQWLNIEGFENKYQISNWGRVKSLLRPGTNSGTRKTKILKPWHDKCGYALVGLTNRKIIRICYLSHRLVAKAFIPNPENKPVINHKNNIHDFNHVSNLEWMTSKENACHARDNHYMENARHRGSKNGFSKLIESQVIEIRQLFKSGQTNKTKLSQIFGVTDVLIGKIIRNEIWKHVQIN